MKERVAMILAAGRGRRMESFGGPKVMAGLYDRPILHHVIETVLGLNPDRLGVVIGHKGEEIVRYFGCPSLFNYQEQKVLNGNAGAVEAGLRAITPDVKNILVIQGDDSAFYTVSTLSQLLAVHERSGAEITVLITRDFDRNTHKSQFLVRRDGRIFGFRRGKIDPGEGSFFTGTVCFRKEFLKNYLRLLVPDSSGELVVPQLFELALADSRKMYSAVAPHGEWVGINSLEELCRANDLKSLSRL